MKNKRKGIDMKKTTILLSALLIASAALVSSCSSDPDAVNPPSGMTLACDPEVADYYFFVPEGWTVDLTTSASGAYYSTNDPSSVSMMVWELEHTDTTLDDWWTANVADLELVFQNFTLESEENTTVDDNYAKQYVYTADLGENHYKFMQVGTLKNGKVYLFTYTSVVDNYDSHLEDVAKMIESVILE